MQELQSCFYDGFIFYCLLQLHGSYPRLLLSSIFTHSFHSSWDLILRDSNNAMTSLLFSLLRIHYWFWLFTVWPGLMLPPSLYSSSGLGSGAQRLWGRLQGRLSSGDPGCGGWCIEAVNSTNNTAGLTTLHPMVIRDMWHHDPGAGVTQTSQQ